MNGPSAGATLVASNTNEKVRKMNRVNVYRYDYFDRLLKHDRRSVDYATGDAIASMGGKPLAETQRSVDEDLVPDSGIIRAADMPPREILNPPARASSPGWGARRPEARIIPRPVARRRRAARARRRLRGW